MQTVSHSPRWNAHLRNRNIDDAVSWYERNASTGDLIFGGVLKDGDNGDTVDGLNGAQASGAFQGWQSCICHRI